MMRFNVNAVSEKIKELRPDAPAGPDGIGPHIPQEIVSGLAPVLVTIFSKLMATGGSPGRLERSKHDVNLQTKGANY